MDKIVTIKKISCLLLAFNCVLATTAQDNFQSLPSNQNDSFTAVASTRYTANTFFRKKLMGSNYRKEWNMPVTLPVFHMSNSGFTIKELGGGMQTKSLRLADNGGKQWALRTVEKSVTDALPAFLQNTLAERVTQDLISAAFPYGAAVVGELANALGLSAARPRFFYVADDSAFGELNEIFAHTICSLEERDPGFDSTQNTNAALENIQKDFHYKIQQSVFLKARLLDMVIADWDRHADNWRWGLKDSAGYHFYYAVPRDRDWAFYKSEGLLPKLMQFTGGMRHLVSFKEDIANLKDQSWKAWTLDKTFLNELSKQDWQRTINEVQQLLSDKVIEKAAQQMPTAVFDTDGASFIKKLKGRRDGLQNEVLKYYDFISKEIIINGTNESDRFLIRSVNDSLVVTMYAAQNEKVYERSFSPSETYFITINGLNGEDKFEVDENAVSKIKITINGDGGTDTYRIKGHINTKIYDSKSSQSIIEDKGIAKIYFR